MSKITIKTASEITGISKVVISEWLRRGQCFGEAIKTKHGYSYMISPKKLSEFLGISVSELEERIAALQA